MSCLEAPQHFHDPAGGDRGRGELRRPLDEILEADDRLGLELGLPAVLEHGAGGAAEEDVGDLIDDMEERAGGFREGIILGGDDGVESSQALLHAPSVHRPGTIFHITYVVASILISKIAILLHRPSPDKREHLGDLLGVGGEPFPVLRRDPAAVAGHELDDEERELGPLLLVRQDLGVGRVEPRDGHRDFQLNTVVGQERVHLVVMVNFRETDLT